MEINAISLEITSLNWQLQIWDPDLPRVCLSLRQTYRIQTYIHSLPPHPSPTPSIPCLLLYITILFVNVKLEAQPFSAITRFVVCKHFNILHGNPFAGIQIFIQVTKKQLFPRKGFGLTPARRCVTGETTPPPPPRRPLPPPSGSHFSLSPNTFRSLRVCVSHRSRRLV